MSDKPSSWGLGNFIGLDAGELVSSESILILGLAGITSAWVWDESAAGQHQSHNAADRSWQNSTMEVGNLYGSGWVVAGGSLSLLATAKIVGNQKMEQLGIDLFRSYAITGLTTLSLKSGIERRRPSGGLESFPSGHTSSAFSTVPIIWHHLGWQAGLVSCVLAVSTGFGRIEGRHHYASDVVVGAALGLVVGRAIVGRRDGNILDHVVVTPNKLAISQSF